ncbi:MFS general substrate transporter [Periconia macrospinosa]|uniref:MFS general substrate transporter n=1 Tax=Periconia macrospinosa TaxID=97972 RepID=A0A2V1D5M3_9PLEO|nr:MFS general substrate transporter [Periconia macrospinosa]
MQDSKKLAQDEVQQALSDSGLENILASGVNERKLKLKLDLFILPLLASIFFLAVIGQSNIGNAYQAGLAADLSLTPHMFANVNSLFIIGYVVGQLPATLLLRHLGPQRQFAGAMIAWGLLTIGASYAKNYATLVVCRVLIALSESMIQGALLYLSFWYKYEELATRASVLSATYALAGAFSGLLAYAIQKNLDGHNGWRAWRWIFLVEGILPVGWSVVIALFLPPTPNSIRRGFSAAEKTMLVRRAESAHNTGDRTIAPRLILRVLADPQFWLIGLIQGGMLLCSSSTSNFLPTIMTGLGYEGVRAQLMSVIPYAVSFVCNIVICRLSDLSRLRGVWILGCCLVTAVGYIVLLTTTNLAGRLVATCLITGGANAPATICFAWMASANVGYTYRGSALSMINIMAHLIALGGQQAFIDPPLYRRGETVSVVVVLVTAGLTVVLLLYFRRMNAKKRREQYSEQAEKWRGLSIDEIGNRHPDFFFSF